ncbi:MAG: GTP cyclohydrolase FolE2 [Candidatus Cloacimonetes bacterium]|nr:GTP cyclohydrolase FolE2 [Candidatus Cloacimonadota bacterium]
MLSKDIQNLPDSRKEKIDKVGVKNLKYPIIVQDRVNELQKTIAEIDFFVELPHHYRGTHMSRFIEVLNQYHQEDFIENLPHILASIKQKLSADRAYITLKFPYFMEKKAPVSGIASLLNYNCTFVASLSEQYKLTIGVEVPITTVCPCSKEISQQGAHNQRSIVTVLLTYNGFIWLEEIIEYVESIASSEVYPLLKREDEKFLTEKGYENPKFVEDIVRDLAILLKKDKRITGFKISSENYESIHNHNAYAYLEWERKKDTD